MTQFYAQKNCVTNQAYISSLVRKDEIKLGDTNLSQINTIVGAGSLATPASRKAISFTAILTAGSGGDRIAISKGGSDIAGFQLFTSGSDRLNFCSGQLADDSAGAFTVTHIGTGTIVIAVLSSDTFSVDDIPDETATAIAAQTLNTDIDAASITALSNAIATAIAAQTLNTNIDAASITALSNAIATAIAAQTLNTDIDPASITALSNAIATAIGGIILNVQLDPTATSAIGQAVAASIRKGQG